jgi:hypothetical protein
MACFKAASSRARKANLLGGSATPRGRNIRLMTAIKKNPFG